VNPEVIAHSPRLLAGEKPEASAAVSRTYSLILTFAPVARDKEAE